MLNLHVDIPKSIYTLNITQNFTIVSQVDKKIGVSKATGGQLQRPMMN